MWNSSSHGRFPVRESRGSVSDASPPAALRLVLCCLGYAAQGLKATGVTLHGYMGRDSVEPFLRDPRCGVFVLCKTSNPSSDDMQSLTCIGKDGKPR